MQEKRKPTSASAKKKKKKYHHTGNNQHISFGTIPPGLQVALPGVNSALSVIYSAYHHKQALFCSATEAHFDTI